MLGEEFDSEPGWREKDGKRETRNGKSKREGEDGKNGDFQVTEKKLPQLLFGFGEGSEKIEA